MAHIRRPPGLLVWPYLYAGSEKPSRQGEFIATGLGQSAYIRPFAGGLTHVKPIVLAARHGNVDAQVFLAHLYEAGALVEKNLEKAFEWYEKAGESGDVQASFQVARMYEDGNGVIQNIDRAVAIYQRLARAGHAPSQFELGRRYEKGEHVDCDMRRAAYWYEKAARLGHMQAARCLEGVAQKDETVAGRLLAKARGNRPPK